MRHLPVLFVLISWAVPSAAAPSFLDDAAGVYKKRFANALVDGTKYESEDVLEVVPLEGGKAYVRMDLQFFNGHLGGIYGIATSNEADRTLVYDNGQSGEGHCIVTYLWEQTQVVTKVDYGKNPGCRSYHGARGSLDGAVFERKSKRAIKYIKRLKDSREYRQALEEKGLKP